MRQKYTIKEMKNKIKILESSIIYERNRALEFENKYKRYKEQQENNINMIKERIDLCRQIGQLVQAVSDAIRVVVGKEVM